MSRGGPGGPPSSVVILGAGTMGSGMALAFARAGTRVLLTTRRESTLDRARAHLDETLEVLVGRRVVPEATKEEILGRIGMTTRFEAVDFAVDLVVESVAEDLDLKRDILRRAEERASPRTIVATNTSSLPLKDLSTVLERPERFAGYHWFNPPELIELVEVVSGPRTDEDTARRLVGWSEAIGKQPVLIRREIEGFVANRLQYALIREAYALVAEGICTVEDVDRVITTGLGPRWAAVGPFESMDLAGLDVHHEVVRRLFPTLSNLTEPPAPLERLVSEGSLGAKTGRGLRGDYGETAVRRVIQRRARILLTLAALHEEERER